MPPISTIGGFILIDQYSQLATAQQDSINLFVEQLLKWNKAYNLTAITERDAIFIKHIDDSLVISPFLQGARIIDVGTGAGLPGIPLAIANPDKQFVLIDSNGKKIRFIKQIIHLLQLRNVTALHSRVEELEHHELFSSILTRAFASIYDMLTASKHLLAPDGVFLAMKGQVDAAELAYLPEGFYVAATQPLTVTKLDAERNLVVIKCRERLKHD